MLLNPFQNPTDNQLESKSASPMHSLEAVVIKKQIYCHWFKLGRETIIKTKLQYSKGCESKVWITTERSKLEIFVLGLGPDIDRKELPWPLK